MRIAITGASGKLGGYLVRHLASHEKLVAWSGRMRGALDGVRLQPLELTSTDALHSAFQAARPDVIIHTAACSVVSACHRRPAEARAVNVMATERLAALAAEHRARLIFTSTDLVFDGQDPPYKETDPPCPLSIYGRTKQEAEQAVLQYERHAVVRVSLMFGLCLHGRSSFFQQQADAIRAGQRLELFADEWRTPLSLQNAAVEIVRLAKSERAGLLHLGGPERMSRLDMGTRLAAFLQVERPEIVAASQADVEFAEPRPADVSLDVSNWQREFPPARLLTWEEALAEMVQ